MALTIRHETPLDREAVHAVNAAAFETHFEADLVEALRRKAQPIVSLVAERDGGIVGHILFSPVTVGFALIGGALLILVVEALPLKPTVERAEAAGWKKGLAVGFAQCLALWPGFSRSAATILGGMTAGLDRRAATADYGFLCECPRCAGVD